MRFVPGIREHSLEIDFFLAERTDLLFADDAPTANAKLVKSVPTGQSECPERGRKRIESAELCREHGSLFYGATAREMGEVKGGKGSGGGRR